MCPFRSRAGSSTLSARSFRSGARSSILPTWSFRKDEGSDRDDSCPSTLGSCPATLLFHEVHSRSQKRQDLFLVLHSPDQERCSLDRGLSLLAEPLSSAYARRRTEGTESEGKMRSHRLHFGRRHESARQVRKGPLRDGVHGALAGAARAHDRRDRGDGRRAPKRRRRRRPEAARSARRLRTQQGCRGAVVRRPTAPSAPR